MWLGGQRGELSLRGSPTVNVVPRPGRLCTSIVPLLVKSMLLIVVDPVPPDFFHSPLLLMPPSAKLSLRTRSTVMSTVSALNAILAQRLVRLVCVHCAEEELPGPELLAESGLTPQSINGWKFLVGRGCRECRGVGYRGRKAVAELLILNDEMRELITSRAPIRTLKDAAAKNGTRFLREAALQAVRRGQTTLEEINRVTFVA